MTVEIVAIEPGLLFREITNRNVRYLTNQLLSFDLPVCSLTVIENTPARMNKCLQIALDRVDILFIVGDLYLLNDLLFVNSLFTTQDSLCENIVFFKNENRLASGFFFEIRGKLIIGLPESISDLIMMFESMLNPLLKKHAAKNIYSFAIRTFNISESKIQYLLRDLICKQINPSISTFSETYIVTIYLTVIYESSDDPNLLCDPLRKEIEKRIGQYIYGFNNDTMESIVGNSLMQKNIKIALAESCTGGLITSKLINISGISKVLMEGLVTYNNQSKILRLLVRPETIQKYGAVSEETAKEMALGLLRNYNLDISLSVTGIAGPGGGSEDKPVGLVYICIAAKGSYDIYKHQFTGDRDYIREMSCISALNHIRLFMNDIK